MKTFYCLRRCFFLSTLLFLLLVDSFIIISAFLPHYKNVISRNMRQQQQRQQQQQQHQQISSNIKFISDMALQNNKFEKDLEENSRRKAKGGAGETVAGAVLGGLLLGPFGALFGAQIGSGFGASNAVDRARKEEMKRLGITQEMLDTAQECGLALERSREGLKATQDSLATQQSFARMLDRDVEELFEKAKKALQEGNEERARDLLFQRNQAQDKLKGVLKQCAEAKQRLEKMESNVAAIERRAKEVEGMLQRTVAAKTTQDLSSADLDFTLPDEDPLLKKFKDAGID